jgi:hypothetical protein
LDCLTLIDGTVRFPRNISSYLTIYTGQHPRRAEISALYHSEGTANSTDEMGEQWTAHSSFRTQHKNVKKN